MGEEIGKKRTMQAGFFQKVLTDNLSGYNLMSDMLGGYQKQCRKYGEDCFRHENVESGSWAGQKKKLLLLPENPEYRRSLQQHIRR